MTALELLAQWDAQIASLNDEAASQRDNGLPTLAAATRNKRDQLQTCADQLRRLATAPTVFDLAKAAA